MKIKQVTDRWVFEHRSKILAGFDKGYKKDRYTDFDIENIIKQFDFYVSPYYIGRYLFLSIFELINDKMNKIEDPRRRDREIDQIVSFCRLGEYGQRYLNEESFADLIEKHGVEG